MKKKWTFSRVLINACGFLVSAIWWLPLVWSLIIALMPLYSPVYNVKLWFTTPYTLDNFVYVLSSRQSQSNILIWMLNSFFVAGVSTLIIAVLSLCASFSFSRFKYRGQKVLYWLVMAGMMIPQQSLMIPLYIFCKDLKILNTYWCLILPALSSGFGVLLLKQFMDGLPSSLFDAARIDGCNSLRQMVHLVIPLMRPALASLAIFVFLQRWNDFLWPFIAITESKLMTVPTGVVFFRASGGGANSMTYSMACTVIIIIPMLLLFFLLQKQLVEGISFSGLKE